MVQVPDTEPEGTSHQQRSRLVPLAVAALIVIAGVATLPITDSGLEKGSSDTTTLDAYVQLPQPLLPEQVAESFMVAWMAGDSEAAASLFRPGTKLHGFEPELFPALHQWYEAMGWKFSETECERHPDPGVDVVGCTYLYENNLTRALGLGPLAGWFSFLIEGGQIWLVSERLGGDRFEFDEGWGDFRDWLLTYHPDDFDRMYERHPNPQHFVFRYLLIDQQAVELWEQYTDEFVAFVNTTAGPRTTKG